MLSDMVQLKILDQNSATCSRGGRPEDATPTANREMRESVLLAAEITRFSSSAITRHRLRDLSPNGAKLDKADALRRGETVLITVGSLAAIGAIVMWVAEGAAGVQFFETIDPAAARAKTIVNNIPTGRALAPSCAAHAERIGRDRTVKHSSTT